MARNSGRRKKKRSFWRSKEAKRAYWVLGIPCLMLLGWYGYTVAFEFNRSTMSRMESNLKAGIVDLAGRALREGFRTEHFDECQNMVKEYTTPKGWFYSDAELFQLVGLAREATPEQLNERCIYFAKAVSEMQRMSRHDRHVFVCGESIFDIGNKGKFYLKADPQDSGALMKLNESRGEELLPISAGGIAVVKNWQIYNAKDGCVIVGLSKSGIFRMSGTVDYEK